MEENYNATSCNGHESQNMYDPETNPLSMLKSKYFDHYF